MTPSRFQPTGLRAGLTFSCCVRFSMGNCCRFSYVLKSGPQKGGPQGGKGKQHQSQGKHSQVRFHPSSVLVVALFSAEHHTVSSQGVLSISVSQTYSPHLILSSFSLSPRTRVWARWVAVRRCDRVGRASMCPPPFASTRPPTPPTPPPPPPHPPPPRTYVGPSSRSKA